MTFVPRTDIESLAVRLESRAARPMLCAVVGLALLAVSLFLVMSSRHDTGRTAAALIGGVALMVPASWLLNLAFRKRLVMRVKTHRGVRKMLFDLDTDRGQAEDFVSRAAARLGYQYDVSL